MEDFTLENVLKAIDCMYSTNQPQNISEIDKWLKSYQKSQAPWGLVGRIFDMQGLPEYAYIFNAQTLKIKLMFDFEEIKSLDMLLFRNNLLTLSLKFSSQEKVMRQLAQSIGILAIHLVYTWPTMLTDLISAFSSVVPVLLEVMRCIAESISNSSIVVDSENVTALQKIFESQAPEVIKFLETCSSAYPTRVLEVFLDWVQFCVHNEVAVLLPNSNLLRMSCESIRSPAYFETGCKVMCELIYLTENYDLYQDTINALLSFLMSIRSEALNSVNETGVIEGYIKLYTTLGFVHMERILLENSQVILEILVDLCRTKSSDGIYELTQFWRSICKRYKGLKEKSNNTTEFFINIINRLLPICISHFQLTPTELKEEMDKETEGIRYNISIILSYITDILSCKYILELLKNNLVSIFQSQTITEYERYSQIEAIAGCTASISELCDKQEMTQDLMEIISYLCRQIWPYNQINLTICTIFETISKDLDSKTLVPVVEFLISCIKLNLKGKSVSQALKRVLLVNSLSLFPHIPYLLNIQPLCEGLPDKNHEGILEGLATVIWRSPHNKEISSLCSVYTSRLLDHPKEDVLVYNCDKLAIIFKVTVEDKLIEVIPVYNLFRSLWPVLKNLVSEFQGLDNAVEEICRIVKHAIKKLDSAFGEFLDDFLEIVISQFTQFKHSSYLYMAEQLVKIFGESNLYRELMLKLFIHLSNTTLTVLNSVEALTNNPELTEDFFGMVNRNIRFLSLSVLQSDIIENIMILAKAGIGLQHSEAAKCLYGFLEITLDYCDKEGRNFNENISLKLLHHYQDVLRALFRTLVSVVPGQIFEYVEDLIYKILLVDQAPDWLRLALVEIPHDCLTEGEKSKFYNECLSSRNIHNWTKIIYKRAKQRANRLR